MSDTAGENGKKMTPDWLLRGALARIGDSIDKFTGRRKITSSSLAVSELVERLRRILDKEARNIDAKGTVVPHNIQLKVQWDKFAVDTDETVESLRNELLTAAVDHINDSHYYTLAPLRLEVKTDYFTEGVKLLASFDDFIAEEHQAELNVTLPAANVQGLIPPSTPAKDGRDTRILAKFTLDSKDQERELILAAGKSLSIGRTGGNDLVLDDHSVSKMHAAISLRDAAPVVADVGSTNGTFINGERIAYGKAIPLEANGRVRFGEVEVVFEISPAAAEEPEDTDLPNGHSADGSFSVTVHETEAEG
jgi:hypothetical protein